MDPFTQLDVAYYANCRFNNNLCAPSIGKVTTHHTIAPLFHCIANHTHHPGARSMFHRIAEWMDASMKRFDGPLNQAAVEQPPGAILEGEWTDLEVQWINALCNDMIVLHTSFCFRNTSSLAHPKELFYNIQNVLRLKFPRDQNLKLVLDDLCMSLHLPCAVHHDVVACAPRA